MHSLTQHGEKREKVEDCVPSSNFIGITGTEWVSSYDWSDALKAIGNLVMTEQKGKEGQLPIT